ncbi:MAG: hypothetical protein MI922_13825, partial [Bacteroidales bacterium]|nr:hypothetical protein [Bacteroidales bacterium]
MTVFFSIGIAQALFSILLIGKKRELIIADKVLMILLVVLGAEFVYSLLNFEYIPEIPDFIIFPFLVGPLLYLYAYLLSSEDRKLPPRFYYHFIPFALFLVLAVIFSKHQIIGQVSSSEDYNPGGILIFNFLAFAVQSIAYWRIITQLVNKHKLNLLHKVSVNTDAISLNWIKLLSLFVFWGFILFFLIDVSFFFRGNAPFESSILLHTGMLIA